MTPSGLTAVAGIVILIGWLCARPAFLRAMVDARLAELNDRARALRWRILDGGVAVDSALARHVDNLVFLGQRDPDTFPGLLTFSVSLARKPKNGQGARLAEELRGPYRSHQAEVAALNLCLFDTLRYRSFVLWALVKVLTAVGVLERSATWLAAMLRTPPPAQHLHA